MRKKIILTKIPADIIMKSAVEEFPNECCGFIFGRNENVKNIDVAIPVINRIKINKPKRFEVSPLDYVRAEKYALDNGIDFLGIYHSHPNHSAIPSEFDLANALPFFSYIIVSVNEDSVSDMKSWQLDVNNKIFVEEHLVIK